MQWNSYLFHSELIATDMMWQKCRNVTRSAGGGGGGSETLMTLGKVFPLTSLLCLALLDMAKSNVFRSIVFRKKLILGGNVGPGNGSEIHAYPTFPVPSPILISGT